MLRVVTGPFHPNLEQALTDDVLAFKAADPLAAVAVVVPSTPLLSRLRERLVVEGTQPLLNVYFLTFHQLARRLYEEQCLERVQDEALLRIETVPDFFFEHLIERLAQEGHANFEPLKLAERGAGARAALWATIRDLKDATVDPLACLRALEEGLFGPREGEEAQKLRALFMLYAAVLETSRALEVGTRDDVVSAVVPWVPSSQFLTRLHHIYYYGFYDLTQVQLSLLEAAVRRTSVTIYFPLSDDSSYDFAKRFFDRHIQPLVDSSTQLRRARASDEPVHSAQDSRPSIQVFSTVGPEDELTLVCKEVLRLVETQGYRFDEVGVVARTLAPYEAALRRVFDRHRIPFATTGSTSARFEPAAKILLQFATLPLTDFPRRAVLDVVTSPFYVSKPMPGSGPEPRTELWRLAVSSLGITRGEEEWARLSTVGGLAPLVGDRAEADESEDVDVDLHHIQIDGDQLRLLWGRVSGLIRDFGSFPTHGTYAELTDAFTGIAARYLAVPGISEEWNEQEDEATREPMVALDAAIQDTLMRIRQLDCVGGTITYAEWVQTFTRAMEQAVMPIAPWHRPGVRVLDAMAARGLPFRALFLLGLNEKVFPRFITEDAFLHDRHRRVLDETIGYKIDEKLAGYDEETLLFALLTEAAGSRLYLLHQRADRQGRVVAPSPFLAEIRGTDRLDGQPGGDLPRRLADRVGLPQFEPSLQTHEELALHLVLQGRDPSPAMAAGGRDALLFHNGWESLRGIESQGKPGDYDGVTGPLDGYWQDLTARGLSPTPLEQYARCPFQYFCAQVLELDALRHEPEAEFSARSVGDLCHSVLRACYQRVIEAGSLERLASAEARRDIVESSSAEVFRDHAAQHGVGHALLWQLTQERVKGLVSAVMQADADESCSSGFRPFGVEVESEGRLEGLPSLQGEALKIRGRVDRVDRRINPPGIRMVDYKYRHGGRFAAKDRKLVESAIRGLRLQPPFYALLHQDVPDSEQADAPTSRLLPERVELLFLSPSWETSVERATFESSAWHSDAAEPLRQTIDTLVEGIGKGRYVIVPGRHCDACDFSPVCRRFHQPTWWRGHHSASARELRRLRNKKVTYD